MTTAKHRNFVSEPMGEKPVTELAGIGPALGGRLVDHGYAKAYQVLAKFLEVKKNEENFRAWLGETCYADENQARHCFNCLRDW